MLIAADENLDGKNFKQLKNSHVHVHLPIKCMAKTGIAAL